MKRLHIYDLDLTLIKTVGPEIGVHIFKEKTGLDWPYLGWFSKAETLNLDIFDIPLNEWVYSEYLKSHQDPDTYTALVTGRIKPLKEAIQKILDKYEVKFDEFYCNWGGPTLNFKMKVFDQLVEKFKDTLEEVIIYDDRDEHIGSFIDWSLKRSKETGIKISVIHVK